MELIEKLSYFDYFLSAVIAFGAPEDVMGIENKVRTQFENGKSISKLKAFKLLFFAVACDNSEWKLLDDVFDKFYALPYGPVESEIYDNLNSLTNYKLDGNNLVLKERTDFSYSLCEKMYLDRIIDAVNTLGIRYPHLYTMSAIELVELSHRSDCWQIAINQARSIGSLSSRMSHDVIKQSKVYFF